MATGDDTFAAVPHSVYTRYTGAEVLEMLDIDEPMRLDSMMI